jgi:hypothetical protein
VENGCFFQDPKKESVLELKVGKGEDVIVVAFR